MPPVATILIPTFDHGPTIRRSIESALAQTVGDIEVFVVGDGVPDVTREILAEFAARDGRVRFFDNAKGPRHGELYRHAALAEARGRIVCYLSDDDLYTADHVQIALELLTDSDFANTLPSWVDAAGAPHLWAIDLSLEAHRRRILEHHNRIPFSCGFHTMELYRRLPFGWRTTPVGTPTDHHMWKQILGVPGVRARSGFRPTVIHPPSVDRPGVSIEERVAELDRWAARMLAPDFRDRFLADVVAESAATIVRFEVEQERDHAELGELRRSCIARALSRFPRLDRIVRRVIHRPRIEGRST